MARSAGVGKLSTRTVFEELPAFAHAAVGIAFEVGFPMPVPFSPSYGFRRNTRSRIADPANIEIRIASEVTRQVRSLVLPVDFRPSGRIRDIKRPYNLEALEHDKDVLVYLEPFTTRLPSEIAAMGIEPPLARAVPVPDYCAFLALA
jgi:hypothetical protein